MLPHVGRDAPQTSDAAKPQMRCASHGDVASSQLLARMKTSSVQFGSDDVLKDVHGASSDSTTGARIKLRGT